MRRLPLLAILTLVACKEHIPKLKDACVADMDCALTVTGDDCCAGCQSAAANLTSLNARQAWCEKRMSKASCPERKCTAETITVYCQEDRCVVRSL